MATRSRSSPLTWLALALILALAASLRLVDLTGPALWWDEGLNAYLCKLAPAPLLRMSNAVLDSNPPTYRLLLGLWMRLAGDGAFQLRLPSVLIGLGTVWAAFVWGRWQGGVGAGLLAALLMTLNPMAIYRQREAKAYPLVALFAALSCYLWLRFVLTRQRPDWRAWALYTLCTMLAVGSHWYALFLCVAQGVGLVVWLMYQRVPWGEAWGRIWRWAASQVVAVGLWLPWIALSYQAAWGGAAEAGVGRASLGLLSYGRDIAASLVAGPGVGGWRAIVAVGVTSLVVAWSLWPSRRDRVAPESDTRARLVSLVALIVVPLALGYVAQCVLSFMDARFFFYVATPLAVLLALGLVRMRWLALPVGAALLLAWGLSLPEARGPYATPQDDLRPLSEAMRAYARPDDAAVVAYIWQEGILRMYAPEVQLHYVLGWYNDEDVAPAMEALFAAHRRVWLVTFRVPLQDPVNTGGWWLEQHAARYYHRVEGNNQLVGYTRCALGDGAAQATFGDSLRLIYSPVLAELRSGDVLCLPLGWQAQGTAPANSSVYVHLADAQGRPWAQSDGAPVNGLRPFETLALDEWLADPRALLVPTDIPEGEYRLLVGVYARDDGRRMRVTTGTSLESDSVVCGTVRVEPN